ncbi:MAG: NAD(P) transhydrogenase subunit alpha [Lentisphaerae bacterium]|jgi:NAD(P) transhydrogenase subunit alpha|nr:NAD(P) transhydrogenase subunit alpha [Lentisphaerota bacterium]
MSAAWLCLLFVVSSVVGYMLISNVPSLLHTPLMSGMNALSGITVVGAIAAVATGSRALALAAVVLAMINVVGGFAVTDRMLKMFKGQRTNGND